MERLRRASAVLFGMHGADLQAPSSSLSHPVSACPVGVARAAFARRRHTLAPRIPASAVASSHVSRWIHSLVPSPGHNRRGAMISRGLSIGLMVFAVQHAASAQCRVDKSSNEGKLLAFYTAPIVFSMATAPEEMRPGSIRLGAEGEYIPKPDSAIERTGVCFTQKSEHTSLSPVFGRPRITIGGPFGFALEAAYLPPVTIARAKPNLFSFAVSHAQHLALGPASSGTT